MELLLVVGLLIGLIYACKKWGASWAEKKQRDRDIEILIKEAKNRERIDEKMDADLVNKRKQLHEWLRKRKKP